VVMLVLITQVVILIALKNNAVILKRILVNAYYMKTLLYRLLTTLILLIPKILVQLNVELLEVQLVQLSFPILSLHRPFVRPPSQIFFASPLILILNLQGNKN
jgi:hypothetical protein